MNNNMKDLFDKYIFLKLFIGSKHFMFLLQIVSHTTSWILILNIHIELKMQCLIHFLTNHMNRATENI